MKGVPRVFRPGGKNLLASIEQRLRNVYSDAQVADLGNKPDPLDEAVFIILTFQTDIPRAKAIWDCLMRKYGNWNTVAGETEERLADLLRDGGLHNQKARTIKRLLEHVKAAFGRLSLDPLREMPQEEAERFLLKLPGFSWKGARCVLLYSLGRDVFPVDINTFRILRRVGVLPRDAVYRRRSLHDGLQAAVPPSLRKGLHVNLVLHGQMVCTPVDPKCGRCVLRPCCRTGNLDEDARRRWLARETTPP